MLAQLGNSEAFALQSPLLAGDDASVPCPRHPEMRMLERQLLPTKARIVPLGGDDSGPLTIDQCPTCHGLWFDGGELDQLAKSLRDSRLAPFLADPAVMDRPGSAWRWIFMLLTGLPVEQWQPRLRRPLSVMTLIALCAVVFLQFFTRYALNDSAAWTEEMARYLLIAVVFIGASMCVRLNHHIQVDLLNRYLPRAAGRALATFVDAVRVGFLGYAIWLTWQVIQRVGHQPMTFVQWPMSVIQAFVMAGFAFMFVRALILAARHLRRGSSLLEHPEHGDA